MTTATKNTTGHPYRVEQKAPNIHVVYIDVKNPATFEADFLLSTDRHHDNAHCNQRLELAHLDEARERRAGIIDAGDLFCAMQGKWDKRADPSQFRPEHREGRYLDSLVSTAADFYEPYAHNFIVMGRGNHETAITRHHETDLTERLVERMNAKTGANINVGGYAGWIRFQFTRGKQRTSRTMFYHHGGGGGGPVTKDIIQTNRKATYLDGVDYVLNGHTHDEWIFPISRVGLSQGFQVRKTRQIHIKTPGYKDSWGTGAGGWELERQHPPKPNGAAWLRFYWSGNDIKAQVNLTMDD